MANQNYFLSPSTLVTVLLILSLLTPAQGSGGYNSSTVSSQQVSSSRVYSPSYIRITNAPGSAAATKPSTLSECYIADSLVVLGSGDTVASTSSVDTQTFYFQVLFQTTSTRKAAVAIVLDYIQQQTDNYMVESCTTMFQNQTVPYRNLVTADQKSSNNMYAIETQYISSSVEPSCDGEDFSYSDCFVMQQNISFFCRGTCSTQSKRLVENSLHDYVTMQMTNSIVRIDWTTGTKLLRIHDYYNARSSNYTQQIQGNPADDSSTNHTLPFGRSASLLLAALIALTSISSVLLFLLYNKRKHSEPAFAQFDNEDDEQIKIVKIWENSLQKYPTDTASTISAPMKNNGVVLHFMEEGAPSTFLPNGNYAIEIGKEQRRMDDNSSYSSTSTAEYLFEGESWDESSSMASSIQNSTLIATTTLDEPAESFHQSHISPRRGNKTEPINGKKSILRNKTRTRDVSILNSSKASRRSVTRKARDTKLTVSFEPFSLVLPPLLSDNDDDNNVEIRFDSKEESFRF